MLDGYLPQSVTGFYGVVNRWSLRTGVATSIECRSQGAHDEQGSQSPPAICSANFSHQRNIRCNSPRPNTLFTRFRYSVQKSVFLVLSPGARFDEQSQLLSGV